jgi:hypothetical protein
MTTADSSARARGYTTDFRRNREGLNTETAVADGEGRGDAARQCWKAVPGFDWGQGGARGVGYGSQHGWHELRDERSVRLIPGLIAVLRMSLAEPGLARIVTAAVWHALR